MTDISAAIGLAQLNRIDEFNDKRIANAAYLNEGLKDVDGIITPYCQEDSKHVYHQYTISQSIKYWVLMETVIMRNSQLTM